MSTKIFSTALIAATLLFPIQALATDTDGPEVGTVSPLSAVYGMSQTYSVSATDSSGVASCTMVVSSIYEVPMNLNDANNLWEVEYTFSTGRSANSIRASCTDTVGNSTIGKGRVISVSDAPISNDDQSTSSEVDATNWSRDEVVAQSPVLIKTACPGTEDFSHPCRTVYFLDNAGKRHAFPNEKVYFTWYADYSNLHIVSSIAMSSFTLSSNVTYHPGTKMVKFPSVRTVYVVARYGMLSPVSSEETAVSLYGNDWNKKIDDVSEAFYSNYTYGDPVSSSVDFSVSVQTASVESINDNLRR